MAQAKHTTVRLTDEQAAAVEEIALQRAEDMARYGYTSQSYKRDGSIGVNVRGVLLYLLDKAAAELQSKGGK